MEKKKISEAHLEILRGIRIKYESLIREYGELSYQLSVLDRSKKAIEQGLENLEKERDEVATALQNEHGIVGIVNLETGEIDP